MKHSTRRARAAALAAIALGATLAAGACAKGDRNDYNKADADTGAAAPATRPTLDAPGAPDSTAGVSQRTGAPGAAGDTLGSKGGAAAGATPKP